MSFRTVDRSQVHAPWEIRAIKWLLARLRQRGSFRLRLGHSLVLEEPEPELYMEIVYGKEEVVVFDMTFTPEIWPRIRDTMQELQWKLEQEYEEVNKNE